MIQRKQAKKLFEKYLNGQCTPEEKKLLEGYLESFQDKKRLWSELRFEEDIKDDLWKKIKSETLDKKSRPVKPLWEIFKYAAIFIGIAGGIYFWQANMEDTKQNLVIQEDAIILRTGENVAKTIDTGETGGILSEDGNEIASQEGDKISYKSDVGATELKYNEIMVPRGKTFELVLSDGTLVHLNSETELRFPVSFIKGMERTVYLKGEAYFEVAKDADHPFSVVANDISVNVLGTHFAVNSYDGTGDYAVLVEGSVSVENQSEEKGGPTVIRPGQKAALGTEGIAVTEVDVMEYLGWRNGRLIFNDEPFNEIVEKIERKYNVDINNQYKALDPIKFYGKFDEESITDLLDTFKESAGFEYEIIDNKIIINEPNHFSP